VHRLARPLRDRAIVFVLLGAGLRRAELVDLNLAQVEPADPEKLCRARAAKPVGVRGRGRTTRTVFLGQDARTALADYLQSERPEDADEHSDALFLAARSVGARRVGGRLPTRSVNTIVTDVGRAHDAQFDDADAERRLGGLSPHDARHTFAYRLSKQSGHHRAELECRLGHANERYLKLYTNPPDDEAARLVEDL